jgi:DNA-binding MarR family transcriptional regulator
MTSPNHRSIERWWQQLERFALILGRVGPDELCCEGLTQRQCAVLRMLVASEGARLSDLAANAGITPSAMTRILEKLEARGLVERVRGTQPDGRAAMVRISPAGRRTRKLLDDLMRERTAKIVSSVPVRERTTILRALEVFTAATEGLEFCALNTPVAKLAKQKKRKR